VICPEQHTVSASNVLRYFYRREGTLLNTDTEESLHGLVSNLEAQGRANYRLFLDAVVRDSPFLMDVYAEEHAAIVHRMEGLYRRIGAL